VIELKRDAIPQVVLNKLWKHTPLQSTFGYNAVALVDGVPRTLGLRDLLQHYLDFQREIVTRRSKYELRKAEARAHILQGYLIALDNLDAVIELIRASKDTETARDGLMRLFDLTEIQAQAILELRLRQLTALERERVEEEHRDLLERIAELRAILVHNRDEEKEHAAMVLEWLRRRDPELDRFLRQYLFTDGSIVALEQEAEEPAPGNGASLGIGSLRTRS